MTMTMAARTYTATLPSGEIETRTTRSARLFYTHVRVIHWPDGRLAVTWHTSEALAAHGRSDHDPQHRYRWSVVPAVQAAGPAAPAAAPTTAPAAPGHADLTGTEWLVTLGRGRAVHISRNRDGDRNTLCDARPDRRGVSPVYDRAAVATCTRCLKAHAAR